MEYKSEVLALLKLYTKRNRSANLNFTDFLEFVGKYVQQYEQKRPKLAALKENTSLQVTVELEEMATQGICTLTYDDKGKLSSLHFPGYFKSVVEQYYVTMKEDPEMLFPDEERLKLEVPGDLKMVLDVKNDFLNFLGSMSLDDENKVIKITFPEDLKSMIITLPVMREMLLQLCVKKMSLFFNKQKNLNYYRNRLYSVFGNKNNTVQDLITGIVQDQSRVYDAFRSPNDFQFRFWTTLSNLIIKDYKDKANKLEEEHEICQACYLLGFYCVYFRKMEQKEKEAEGSLKEVERLFRKEPFLYTLSDIYGCKDSKGLPVLKNVSRERIDTFISERSSKQEKDKLPEIVRLRTPDKKEYYVRKEALLGIFVNRRKEMIQKLKTKFLQRWVAVLKEHSTLKEMKEERAFIQSIDQAVKEEDPIFYSMLNFSLLFLLKDEVNTSYSVDQELEQVLDLKKQDLVSIPQLFQLNREKLYAEARSHLPFMETLPVIGGIVVFLKRLFGGGKKKGKKGKTGPSEKNGTVSAFGGNVIMGEGKPMGGGEKGTVDVRANAKKNRAEYTKRVAELKVHFVGKSTPLDQRLQELIDKWNHLIDPTARENLVEDVNSAVRAFLRRNNWGSSSRTPSVEEIQKMAMRLAEDSMFTQIKRKDPFWRYLEVYIVRVLSEK